MQNYDFVIHYSNLSNVQSVSINFNNIFDSINKIEKDYELQDIDSFNKNSRAKEYIITLDLAKEIAMLEKSKKGTEIRHYFIECEKKLKQETLVKLSPLLKDLKQANCIKDKLKNESLKVIQRELLSFYKSKDLKSKMKF